MLPMRREKPQQLFSGGTFATTFCQHRLLCVLSAKPFPVVSTKVLVCGPHPTEGADVLKKIGRPKSTQSTPLLFSPKRASRDMKFLLESIPGHTDGPRKGPLEF